MDPESNNVPLDTMVADTENIPAQFLELLPVGVCVCDAQGIIKKYNSQATSLWGRIPQSGERFCGAHMFYYPDGKYLPHEETPMAACLMDGLPRKDWDLVMERPGGQRVMVRINIAPIVDKQGAVKGMVNSYQEMPWKEELQDYVENAAIGLHWVDANGIILWANQAELDLLGYEKEEYIGHHISEFHESREVINDILERLTRNETLHMYEAQLRRKDGGIKTVHIHSNVFRVNGEFIHTRCFTVDITALRESEKMYRSIAETGSDEKAMDLKRSEEQYHKMIEEVDDYAILLMDKSGIIQNWNRGAEKIKGYKDFEIIGKSFQLFYLPEDRESGLPQKLINEAHRTGKAVQEGWRIRKDGTRFWGSIVITALHDADNNVIGFSKVTRDLTDKKRAEDRINQYAKELEFQNRELEQFAYIAAHDMKEPLRKIQFYSDYIYEHSGQLPEKMKDYLGRSIQAAARMKSLIEDLLSYSKASSISQNQEAVDLNELVKEVIAANRETIENNDAVIEVGTLPVVQVVPFQFSQLFDNLLNNSLKYRHPDRAPHIKISAEKLTSVPFPASEQKNACFHKISFEDNGIGFDPSYGVKIFDLFQRLHTQSDYSGSGVGLAICKKIIQNHQGFIQAKGQLNEGAVFEVYIPCIA
ncbi:PAS domain-containing sensor histidine kinase [Chitinophaga niabensis]|uniref:histidine kinase n=1 Tax=Chitinophaga niabensis TaxID=536979 RepID=A0A1N6J2V4_9BACT|nr:PAS domain-containing sensor histidine kinase [Chitinophaga niabensis]SIO38587.1 PAS domain S-box-containing protein [Chitinophaga niabensis]